MPSSSRLYDSWFGSVIAELDMLSPSDFDEPIDPVQAGEKKLGVVVNDAIRAIYTIAGRAARSVDTAKLNAHYAKNIAEQAAHTSSLKELNHKGNMLTLLLWTCVRHEIGVWHKDLGYRSGWQLVEIPSRPPSPRLGLINLLEENQ